MLRKWIVSVALLSSVITRLSCLLRDPSMQSMSELMKRRKKLTEPEVRFYITQLTGALAYLHDNNIIHRDLKLGNIFLDGNMRVKVGDFGLAARLSHAGERRMTLCGTPNYIAPEILQRKHGHSFEVDIWSTGIIIYTLLCGRPPYESKDVDSTYKRILHNQYSFPDHAEVSEAARGLIQDILQLKPEARLTLQQIDAHPFFTSRDVYTPAALTSAAMREVPSSCASSEGKTKASGAMPVLSDENDPGALNRLPQQSQHPRSALSQALRDSSPPRKMAAHVPSLPGASRHAEQQHQQASVSTSSDERRNKQRVGSVSRSAAPVTSQTSIRSRSSASPQTEVPPPGPVLGVGGSSCFSERSKQSKEAPALDSRAHSRHCRQFTVYSDAKQHTRSISVAPLAAVDSHCKRSNLFEGKHKANPETETETDRYGADIYKLEAVENFGGGMELDEDEEGAVEGEGDEEVALLQRSLEQCGLVQEDTRDLLPLPPPPQLLLEREVQAPSTGLLATPAASTNTSRRGGNVDTLECMYETLERSLVCAADKIDFAGEDCAGHGQLQHQAHVGATGVWVVQHVDYTSKYGLGFLMNTGSAGVYFNDSTKIVLSANGVMFQYIERRRRSNGVVEHTCQAHTLDAFPADLNKKVTLLKHFKNYLEDQQSQSQGQVGGAGNQQVAPSQRAMQLMRDMDDALEGGEGAELPYVKKWVRTRHAILFRLSNKTVQVVFFDQSEVLLACEARVVSFVSKEGQRSEHTLDDVFRSGRSDIAKRLKYTKDIMSRLINLQQPRDR